MSIRFNGHTLLSEGFPQGKWFGRAIEAANSVLDRGGDYQAALSAARACEPAPVIPLSAGGATSFFRNIIAENKEEEDNIASVEASMTELMRTPIVRAGAIMPDACPAGPKGTIPVGGIIAAEGIMPGAHSADICCSMAITVFHDVAPKALLDAVHSVTHFGPGGRARGQQVRPSDEVLSRFAGNTFLNDGVSAAIEHFATQGDGNHFAYVGTLKSTGETALVTHHGSRGPGAKLYAKGMKVAEQFRLQLSPETLKQNAWIPPDTREADSYWEALQVIRAWTKENHFKIHDLAADLLQAKSVGRLWNEHNFLFLKSDGLFYHAKGATPAFNGWAEDAGDTTLIPLNMGQPILLARGRNAPHALGFAPHGAGRNYSRTHHKRLLNGKSVEDVFAEETKGLDVRFFSGVTDISELPSAYKSAPAVRAQIEKFGLADIVDEVLPYGSIMAGDWGANAPWRQKRAAKR